MVVSIKIVSSSEMTRSKPYGKSAGSNSVDLSREIYNNLSSIIKSSSMVYNNEPKSKFEEFMKDFNNLFLINNGLTDEEMESLSMVDEFFGLLGISETYPIVQDAVGNQSSLTAKYKKLNTRN